MSPLSTLEILEQIGRLHVVVIGDLMLDQYIFGQVARVSPEAPVPVLTVLRKETRLGGAANVALNCKAVGANVTVASIIGNDAHGRQLRKMLEEAGIKTDLLHESDHRITTTKSRVISKQQQMMRLDEEILEPISPKEEHPFIDATLRYLQIQKPDLVIFEDYNKGVLKANVIQRVIEHCKNIGIPTAVDPKFDNFFEYKGVDIFKPNLKEVQQALKKDVLDINLESMQEVHQHLYQQLNHQVSLITLSEHGMYYCNNETEAIIPSKVRVLADVSGAGDTVIALAAMVYAVTKDVYTMANWSNIAGGLVCEVAGVVPVDKAQLQEKLEQLNN
jgi:rfaE bifunctional protein kinase chain/domain